MIEPQVHNGQRKTIVEQHGMAKLLTTLDALSQGQTAQQQRDTRLQEQLTTLTQHVAILTTKGQQLVLAIAVLSVLTLGLCGLVGWQLTHRPDMAYARALGALDQAVVQQWPQLSKAVQEQLSATYGRLGLVPPSQRK